MRNFILFISITLTILILILLINLIYSKITSKKLTISTHLNENITVINGVKINFIKKGSGKPILLLHGFMNSLLFLDEIIESLCKNYTVYAIDIIGFGLSDKNPRLDYTKKNMAKIAVEFMLSQKVDKFDVLGHSMGGEVALNMAYYFPQNINRMILVNSAGYIKNIKPFYFIERIKWAFFLFTNFFFRTYFVMDLIFKLALYDKRYYSKKMLNDIFIQSQSIPFKTLYKMSIQNNHSNIGNIPESINSPALIIWGRNDLIVPLKYGKRLHSKLKNSKLIVYDKCGHIPFLEKKDDFLNDVQKFLSS